MGTEQLKGRDSLRKYYKDKRRHIPEVTWQHQSQLICGLIARWHIFRSASVIFSFISHQKEPDLTPLLKFPDKTWALPRCHQDQIKFHFFNSKTCLVPNSWGILEPPPDAPVMTPDRHTLGFVPGIAFDRHGYRLGFGKGYYDRFFAIYPHCLRVGVLFRDFLLDDTYPQPWDIKMNYLVHNGTIEPV